MEAALEIGKRRDERKMQDVHLSDHSELAQQAGRPSQPLRKLPELAMRLRRVHFRQPMSNTYDSARPDDASDLRIGWLESFLSAACHRSFEHASGELGINAANVQRNVRSLEKWLRRDLFLKEQPLTLNPWGEELYETALFVLTEIDGSSLSDYVNDDTPAVGVGKSLKSMIRISDLQAFAAVSKVHRGEGAGAERKGYQRAEAQTGLTAKSIRESVRRLEKALSSKLTSGRLGLSLTDEGSKLGRVVDCVINRLFNSRAPYMTQEEITKHYLRVSQKMAYVHRVILRLRMKRLESKQRLRQSDKQFLSEARASLFILDKACEELDAYFGPLYQNASATHIDMDDYLASRPK